MNWICPECGKSFRNKHQWHSCYKLSIEDHLKMRPPRIRELVFLLISEIRQFGSVDINPVKSVIQVKAGATFLSIKPKKDHIELEFQLDETIDYFPVHKYVIISGKRTLHYIYVQEKEDIDDQLLRWLRQSYRLVNETSR